MRRLDDPAASPPPGDGEGHETGRRLNGSSGGEGDDAYRQPGGSYDAEITALYGANATCLFGYLRMLGADWHTAEDIGQDSFLAVTEQWPRIHGYAQPKAYLFKVATHRFYRLMRKGRRDTASVAALRIDEVAPERSDPSLDLQRALHRLPPRQHAAVLLHYLYGFSVAETAQILQISEGTVKNYLHCARARLAELLQDPPSGLEGVCG